MRTVRGEVLKLSKNVKKQILNIAFVVLLVGITFAVLLASNDELSYADVKDYFGRCNFWLIACGVICMLLFIFFEGLSLHVICRKLGYKPKMRSSIAYSASDVYYSAITPSATGGQPASAFYMVRDGIDGGTSGFALMFNLLAYTGAILVIGLAAFAVGWSTFGELGTLVKVVVLIGLVVQVVLFSFFFACMKYHNVVRKLGRGGIVLLTKMRLMKKPEKWLTKWDGVVEKYHNGFVEVKKHKGLFGLALLLNVLQRLSQVMITYFVIAAVLPNANVLEVFAAQAFVTLGYNSIPLPGGVGAFEFLYLNTYRALGFDDHFVVIAVMITRLISYYLCMLLSGGYTLVYHLLVGKKNKKEGGRVATNDLGTKEIADENEEKTEDRPTDEIRKTEEEKYENDK